MDGRSDGHLLGGVQYSCPGDILQRLYHVYSDHWTTSHAACVAIFRDTIHFTKLKQTSREVVAIIRMHELLIEYAYVDIDLHMCARFAY